MDPIPQEVITVVVLLFVLLTPLLLYWYTLRVRKGTRYAFRRIPAFERLRGLLVQAVESGKTVHVSLGSTGIGGDQTMIVSAGLSVLRYLAEQGISLNACPIVTVADPTAMILAQDVLYRVHAQKGRASSYRSTNVRLIAPDPTAYAVGAQDVVDDEGVAANVMVGHFGEEYLLLGEAGAQRGILQVTGTDALPAHPFMVATTENALLGEEAFANAYLTGQPVHVASLRLQDALRVLLVVAILVGVLAKTWLG